MNLPTTDSGTIGRGHNGLSLCFRFVIALVIATVFSLAGCSIFRNVSGLYPPILDQEEIGSSYDKIATIEFSSERIGNVAGLTPQDHEWAYSELRERAYHLGADAVISPEVRVERDTFLFFPSSQIRARGVAVKFR